MELLDLLSFVAIVILLLWEIMSLKNRYLNSGKAVNKNFRIINSSFKMMNRNSNRVNRNNRIFINELEKNKCYIEKIEEDLALISLKIK